MNQDTIHRRQKTEKGRQGTEYRTQNSECYPPSVVVQRETDIVHLRLIEVPCLRQGGFLRHEGVLAYHFEKVCWATGLKTATHTVIRHTQPAIPGRLLLSRACFRLTGQWHCYHLFDYCQVVIHHDALRFALRASLAAVSLASRSARIVSARPSSLFLGVM